MSSIPAAAGALAGGNDVSTSGFSDMSSEDFIKIIFTELQQQDPFEPNDSSALLEQLNSIRQIESDIQMTEQLESIVFQNQLASAGNLIGNVVQGILPTGDRVAGTVLSVMRQGDSVSLELDTGWLLPMDNVEIIVDPDKLPDLPGADGASDEGAEGSAEDGSGESAESGESEGDSDESGEQSEGESNDSADSDESDESEEETP
jgi:flagellar basal-body rod modification protein FlgD